MVGPVEEGKEYPVGYDQVSRKVIDTVISRHFLRRRARKKADSSNEAHASGLTVRYVDVVTGQYRYIFPTDSVRFVVRESGRKTYRWYVRAVEVA